MIPAKARRNVKFLKGIFGFLSQDMAIDLGTANTLVYVRGRGSGGFAEHFVQLLGNAYEGGAFGKLLKLAGADIGAG